MKPKLSQEAEAGLIKAMLFLNYRGMGMSKEGVFKPAKAEGNQFTGESGLPTDRWWKQFRRRALQQGSPISLRVPRNLSHISRAMSGSDSRLKIFFELVKERVIDHGMDPKITQQDPMMQ